MMNNIPKNTVSKHPASDLASREYSPSDIDLPIAYKTLISAYFRTQVTMQSAYKSTEKGAKR